VRTCKEFITTKLTNIFWCSLLLLLI